MKDELRENDFRALFFDDAKPPLMSEVLGQPYWDMLFVRHCLPSILHPGDNELLRAIQAEGPFCPHEFRSVMIWLCPGCFVYDDSGSPELARCGHCGLHVLDRTGIHAIDRRVSGYRRVARHERPANIVLRWLESSAGPAFQGKYYQGKAKGLPFGKGLKPADAFIFPPVPAPVRRPNCRPSLA